MSRLESLRRARKSTSVQFMNFMKAVSGNRSILVCFFEGEDEKYFSIRLDTLLPQVKWTGINCGGKSSVISLRDIIRSHADYKESFAAFFIDNDFGDDTVDNKNDFYITSCYSIENLYASAETFEKIITAEFGMSEFCSESSDFEIAKSIFNDRLEEFCQALLPFNIWIKAHRIIEKSTDDKSKQLNLNNLKIQDLVEIDLSSVSTVYDCEDVSALFSNSFTVDIEQYSESETYFDKQEKGLELFLRGKQQLEFLRVLLTQLRDECSKKDSTIFSKKRRVTLQLSKANTLSELSQYAITPSCLVAYLNNLSHVA